MQTCSTKLTSKFSTSSSTQHNWRCSIIIVQMGNGYGMYQSVCVYEGGVSTIRFVQTSTVVTAGSASFSSLSTSFCFLGDSSVSAGASFRFSVVSSFSSASSTLLLSTCTSVSSSVLSSPFCSSV